MTQLNEQVLKTEIADLVKRSNDLHKSAIATFSRVLAFTVRTTNTSLLRELDAGIPPFLQAHLNAFMMAVNRKWWKQAGGADSETAHAIAVQPGVGEAPQDDDERPYGVISIFRRGNARSANPGVTLGSNDAVAQWRLLLCGNPAKKEPGLYKGDDDAFAAALIANYATEVDETQRTRNEQEFSSSAYIKQAIERIIKREPDPAKKKALAEGMNNVIRVTFGNNEALDEVAIAAKLKDAGKSAADELEKAKAVFRKHGIDPDTLPQFQNKPEEGGKTIDHEPAKVQAPAKSLGHDKPRKQAGGAAAH